MKRVAVIGGGYAGMAAAVTLAQAGLAVTVLEAARVLGGRARRVEVNGCALDNGLHILLGAYRETLRLMRVVHGSQQVAAACLLRLPLELDVAGEFHLRAPRLPAPLHLAAGLLSASGVTLTDRLAAARFMLWLRRRRYRLARDCTVTELLNGQPERLRRYLWEPLCTSALNTPPREASAQVFVNVLRDSLAGSRSDSDLLLPRVDLSALFPEPAARFIAQRGSSVRLGTAVTALRQSAVGLEIEVSGATERFTHVVVATPSQRAAELLGDLPVGSLRTVLDGLRYEPIYSVYLQYPPGTRLARPMQGVGQALSQWVFDRGQLCAQDGLWGVVISARGAHQDLAQAELAQAVHREMTALMPALPAPAWHQVIAEKRATFACTPNLARPQPRSALANLFIAGDYTAGDYPATLEGAVRSGIACARMVLEEPGAAGPLRHA